MEKFCKDKVRFMVIERVDHYDADQQYAAFLARPFGDKSQNLVRVQGYVPVEPRCGCVLKVRGGYTLVREQGHFRRLLKDGEIEHIQKRECIHARVVRIFASKVCDRNNFTLSICLVQPFFSSRPRKAYLPMAVHNRDLIRAYGMTQRVLAQRSGEKIFVPNFCAYSATVLQAMTLHGCVAKVFKNGLFLLHVGMERRVVFCVLPRAVHLGFGDKIWLSGVFLNRFQSLKIAELFLAERFGLENEELTKAVY
ncbi:MAG: hypothetical protein IK079_03980 [Desulfovibrio sp.]|nr:hypothetical protein [Desulfovibrio sp.]